MFALGGSPDGTVQLLALAVALALDATAANASVGASRGPIVIAAALFGAFQAGMAGLGLLGGTWLIAVASAWDHWIAFVLLGGLGAQMIRKAWFEVDDDTSEASGAGGWHLLTLAFATSVDAAASGLTLPLLKVPGAVSVAVIGVVTGALALGGGLAGRWAGARFGGRLEGVAGVVLIAIGARILAEHTGWLG